MSHWLNVVKRKCLVGKGRRAGGVVGGRDGEGMNGQSEEDMGKPLCEKSCLLPGNAIRKQYQDTDSSQIQNGNGLSST